ncbi:MAG: metallophosphoesterase [Phycisphaerales bacterium]|nr:metallophosphoesterase [Phycisphaerales bacterium]
MTTQPSRRQALKALAAAGLGAAALAAPAALAQPAPSPSRKRVARVAHLTDIHIQPERGAAEGFAQCLRHVHALADKPGLIVFGGDYIMDAFEADEARTKAQWDLFTAALKQHCTIPVAHCLGNHDIWGWNKAKSKTTGKEPRWGKKWAMEVLGLDTPCRAIEVGGPRGWRILLLDGIQPRGADGYVARLDDAADNWLRSALFADGASRPTMVVTHAPILGVSSFMSASADKAGDWSVPAALMHTDARNFRDRFKEQPAVKLAISGHIHRADRCDYLGVTYLNNPAVCGNWWKGPREDFPEAYTLIDLYDDGTFGYERVAYGWSARE